jgi:hypothetical protein
MMPPETSAHSRGPSPVVGIVHQLCLAKSIKPKPLGKSQLLPMINIVVAVVVIIVAIAHHHSID